MKKIFAQLVASVAILSLCIFIRAKASETSVKNEVDTSDVSTEVKAEYVEQSWDKIIKEVYSPNGNMYTMPGRGGRVIAEHQGRCLVETNYGREIWICDERKGFIKLSNEQTVINYTVAQDIIYWFNTDQDVWAANWHEGEEAYLFCEDAIAVSPHTDDAQGAVVTWDRANIDYGYGLPIYSPYGD